MDNKIIELAEELEVLESTDSPFPEVREQRISQLKEELSSLLEKSTTGVEKLYKELKKKFGGGKKKGKLGSGSRFKGLVKKLKARKGGSSVDDPEALAAYIGREKYGKKKFQRMAAAGRK